MAWVSLGNVNPILFDWRFFDGDAIGPALFRLTQTWVDDYPGSGYIQLTCFSGSDGRYGLKRFYFDKEPIIFEYPIPNGLLARGAIIQTFAARLSYRSRIFPEANYRIELEYDTSPIVNPGALEENRSFNPYSY